MEYKTLEEIYYKDKREYENLYKQRTSSSQCVFLDFDVNGNQAFFLETPELLKKVIRIERLKAEVNRMKAKLPAVALNQFANKSLIDEIVITNDIEGVNSTRREIEDILDDLASKNKRNRFLGLVNKYNVLKEKNSISVQSCRDIREIYDELFLREVKLEDPDDVPDGEIFRAGPVMVTNAAMKEIHHGLIPEEKIIAAMEKALMMLNDMDFDVMFRIGLFHYLFGYIHPFYEANGRMARFLSSYLLAKNVEPLLGYRISYTIKENINSYYRAFKTCNEKKNKGDLTPFVIMFTEVIETSIEQLLEALEERCERLDMYVKVLNRLPEGNQEKMRYLYDYLLQAALFSESGVQIKVLMELLDISRTTLAKRLAVVDENGLLLTYQRGKEKYYQLNLDAVDDWK